ncbi:hypothetical protein PTKIN_Ptkin14bG0181400 [Pterospermum kingtungense]
MESVSEEAFPLSDISPESEPRVAFTVVPGFRLGKTVIQCEVYHSILKNKIRKMALPALLLCLLWGFGTWLPGQFVSLFLWA